MLQKLLEKCGWQEFKARRNQKREADRLTREQAVARQRQTANEVLEQLMSYVNAGDVTNTKAEVETYYNVAYMLPGFDDKVVPGYICQAIVNNGLNQAAKLELEFDNSGLEAIARNVARETREFAARVKEKFDPRSFYLMAYEVRKKVLENRIDLFIQMQDIEPEHWAVIKVRMKGISRRLYRDEKKVQEIQDTIERKFKNFVLGDIAKYVQDMHIGLTRKPIDHIPKIERLVNFYNERWGSYLIPSAVYELAAKNIAREIRYNIHGLKNDHKARNIVVSYDLLKYIVEYFYRRINDYSERSKHARDQSMLNRDENQLYVELRDVLNQVIISSNGDLQGSEKSKSKRLLGRFEEDHSRKIMYGRKAMLAEKIMYRKR